MNAPDRYERFVVPEGVKKVSYERDTKIINAATFTIEREDHTVGNILRMQLHQDPNVLFAGYKLPHPLQYKIIVRVSFLCPLVHAIEIHTTSQSSPTQAYNQAINDLDKELDCLKSAFEMLVMFVGGDGEVYKQLLIQAQGTMLVPVQSWKNQRLSVCLGYGLWLTSEL
ncbi:hypothetical protein Cgig2_012854 [Carnegiea gigantea]|uniref:DNA-directed RNA polymerase RBP11-like dimerisation domain-containing protein n=1 Tax=Carnegiea gigantea TaxID=171969 RepID=A0A9Q1GL48_9CARY|nr:hypothetical protein Cgig2_012854 [Carnegiea gigantea]